MQNQKTTPKTLSNDELNKFLDHFISMHGFAETVNKALRDHCMARLMCDAGLRVGEVVHLTQPDLIISDVPVKKLQIQANISKSNTDRLVPLSLRCQTAIYKLNMGVWRYEQFDMHKFAFYSSSPEYHITVRQVERIFKSAGKRSIGRGVNPHMLRHTFGSKMMRVTNAAIVQELMGHKHLSSTQVYMHPNGDDLQEAIDSINE